MSQVSTPARHRAPETERPAPRFSAVRWGFRVLVWLFILTCLAVLAVGVLIPRLGGATPYTVLTGSMKPTLPPGTLVVMKPIEGTSDVGIGTVVTYQLRSGDPTVVTHRVVEVRSDLRGNVEWHTQGDANDVADKRWVKPEQVRGTLWYAVPKLGYVNQWLSGNQRQVAVYGVAGALAIYAGAMFAGALRGRRRTSEQE